MRVRLVDGRMMRRSGRPSVLSIQKIASRPARHNELTIEKYISRKMAHFVVRYSFLVLLDINVTISPPSLDPTTSSKSPRKNKNAMHHRHFLRHIPNEQNKSLTNRTSMSRRATAKRSAAPSPPPPKGNEGSNNPSGFILKLFQMVNGAPDDVVSVSPI